MSNPHLGMSLEHCENSSSTQSPEKGIIQPDQQRSSSAKIDPPPKDVGPWEAVLEVMTKFDDKQISDWMDDLQNLLTFAGLFSAIVTAFVILSYALLQQDSAGLTATTVQSISQQVASFTVGPGYINSSTSIPSAFAPDSLAIKVNTLWILSLTMSLVASLFDIMVQQWLREYRTLTNSSVYDAVRLRELRRRAFAKWAVPTIVSTIPILLEVALVLFFVGQYQLLLAVNRAVFIPFAIFLGITLLLFSIATIMPLFALTCAYKSPTSFILLRAFQGVLWVINVGIDLLFTGVLLLIFVSTGTIEAFVSKMFLRHGTYIGSLLRVTSTQVRFQWFWAKTKRSLRWTPMSQLSVSSEYWAARERSILEKGDATKMQLDESALAWVMPWLPRDEFALLKYYIANLPLETRGRIVMHWIEQALQSSISPGSCLAPGVLDRIDADFVDMFCDALVDVLPETWTNAGKYGPTVLIILQRIAERPRCEDATFLLRHTSKLVLLRGSQAPFRVDNDSSILRLPTVYLFECSRRFPEAFCEADLSTLCEWAIDRIKEDHSQPDHISNWITFFDILLASAATPLCVVAKQSRYMERPGFTTMIKEILGGLTEFVTRDKERIRALASNAKKWCTGGVAFATVPAIEAICKSIVELARTGHLWQESTCPSHELVQSLVGLFEDQKTFWSALSRLQLLDMIPTRGAQSPAEGKDEFLSDPVIPHVGYRPKYMPSSP